MGDRAGLITDFGGVLTTDVFASFRAFCKREGLAPDTVRDLFRSDERARGLLADLECGRLAQPAFEERFAALLGVAPDDLVARLFGGMQPEPVLLDAIARWRRRGVRTALLSNSWGENTGYDRAVLETHFDAVVISGEVGLRKPDPRIYELAAERLGLPPEACVLVDDLPGNLKPARALGMATVRHTGAEATVAELEALLAPPQ